MLDCTVTRIKPQIGVSGETSLNNLDPTMNEPSMERKGKNPTFTGLKIRVSVEKEQEKKIKGTGYSSKTDLAAALFICKEEQEPETTLCGAIHSVKFSSMTHYWAQADATLNI